MICNKCLKSIEYDAQFCNFCGSSIPPKHVTATSEKELFNGGKKKSSYKHDWNKWWANSDETILEQVENYYPLDFNPSYRGTSVLIQI